MDEFIVSRDAIRFTLLQKEDDYFSKEDEVWETYVASIESLLKSGETVYADATHLNHGARLKLLKALDIIPDEIEVIYFKVPLEIAQERNAQAPGALMFHLKRLQKCIEHLKNLSGMKEYSLIVKFILLMKMEIQRRKNEQDLGYSFYN